MWAEQDTTAATLAIIFFYRTTNHELTKPLQNGVDEHGIPGFFNNIQTLLHTVFKTCTETLNGLSGLFLLTG